MAKGSVVKRVGSEQLYMVIHPSMFGALLWPVRGTSVQVGGERAVMLSLVDPECDPRDHPLRQSLIYDHSQWQAAAVCPLPPADAARFAGHGAASAVRLFLKEKAAPLLEFAARRAFANLSVPFLQRLWSLLSPPHEGARPATEQSLLSALLKHCLPGLSPEELADILKMRKSSSKEPSSSVLMHLDRDLSARGFLDEDVQEAVNKLKSAHGSKSGQAHSGPTAGHSEAKLGEAASSSGSAGRVKVSLIGSKTPEFAREYMPKVKLAWVKKDCVRHRRWTAAYPVQQGQGSWSRSYGCHFTEGQALRYCLSMAWQAHTLATGEPCPFDFASELAEEAQA